MHMYVVHFRPLAGLIWCVRICSHMYRRLLECLGSTVLFKLVISLQMQVEKPLINNVVN